jgi:hypothetical protein
MTYLYQEVSHSLRLVCPFHRQIDWGIAGRASLGIHVPMSTFRNAYYLLELSSNPEELKNILELHIRKAFKQRK